MDEFEVFLAVPFRQALEMVEGALKAEGFGVITRIDVQQTMRQKMNIDFRPYTILGACNPPIAHRALERDPRIGLMLPCNVSVETTPEGRTLIRIADPAQMICCAEEEDEVIAEIAAETRKKLLAVAGHLRGVTLPAAGEDKPWERLNHLTDL
jgi:uncharacterized protein (DUF302 family)